MSRLIIISNRLPFSVKPNADAPDGYEFTASSGGLVSALASYLERRTAEDPDFRSIWVGWPGATIDPAHEAAITERALGEKNALPVYLSEPDMNDFYHGFCNSTLWPLFHYFPSYVKYDERHWETYQRVNRAFTDALLAIVRPDDVIWVHDYQLLLMPQMLRQALPDARIGFFLHIPFPSFELFRQLPSTWRVEILRGMLGADLVGFHTHDYTQYFLHSVFRTLGHEHHLGEITMGGGLRRAEAFPIGIDFDKFMTAAASPEVAATRAKLEAGLSGKKAIFSVDRLDYSKGLLHRLRAYETFLELYPDWRGRVVFILIVVPSRAEVEQYQLMKHELDELVGRINGAYGTVEWVPILYQYRSLDFNELVALYNLSPIALITPLRDGMNLVAKEYLASKPDGSGALVLSEMTGAARELGEALLVNPNHRGEVAAVLKEALELSPAEQVRRNVPMQERIKSYNAERWVANFLTGLDRIKKRQGKLATSHLKGNALDALVSRYHESHRRLILLDYDGTLVPFAAQPHLASPDEDVLRLLHRLSSDDRNRVFIVSGRDRPLLDKWFQGLHIQIIAEHGAWIRDPAGTWSLLKPLAHDWKDHIRPLLKVYVDCVPGSLLEEKDFSLAWHYRRADPELGASRAKELIDDVVSYTANFDVQVLEGKKVVEVRNSAVNKGGAALHALETVQPDFVLAAGDDQTDEDLFRALPRSANTIRIGQPHSLATFHLQDHQEMRRVLGKLLQEPSR